MTCQDLAGAGERHIIAGGYPVIMPGLYRVAMEHIKISLGIDD